MTLQKKCRCSAADTGNYIARFPPFLINATSHMTYGCIHDRTLRRIARGRNVVPPADTASADAIGRQTSGSTPRSRERISARDARSIVIKMVSHAVQGDSLSSSEYQHFQMTNHLRKHSSNHTTTHSITHHGQLARNTRIYSASSLPPPPASPTINRSINPHPSHPHPH